MAGDEDGTRGVACARVIWALIAVATVVFMVVGAVFGSIALFRTYRHTFDRLMTKDTVLGQLLYNDTVARQLKDTLLQQQNDATNAELAAETPVRLAGFLELYWAILNETAARIAEEAPLFIQLANETADRIAADTYLAAEIANLTTMVETAEAYALFSTAKFMIIMQNISDLNNSLTTETEERIAADTLLTEQGALADATIAYLTTTLEHETHDRIVQDVLIDEWIAALQTLGLGIESINNHNGSINNNVDIVSTNILTTITAPSPGQLIFTNNAVRTLQGITPAPGGNIVLSVGAGLTIAPFGPHGLHVASTTSTIGPNTLVLSATAIGPFSYPGLINPPGGAYMAMPCNFPMYNGNTCGWSPLDTDTYLVQVSATLTIQTQSAPPGINPAAVHVNMGLARGPYNSALAGPWATTEGSGGALDIVDGANAGNALLLANYVLDMGLSCTKVVQGPGFPGSFPAGGYGVWIFFNGYLQGGTVMAITATYHVTKVL